MKEDPSTKSVELPVMEPKGDFTIKNAATMPAFGTGRNETQGAAPFGKMQSNRDDKKGKNIYSEATGLKYKSKSKTDANYKTKCKKCV